MKNETLMGPWVRRFLLEHLVAERNLSRNTQASYRDTLTLLLPFASEHSGRAIDRMTVEDLTPTIVRKFLDHVENVRGCSGVTRNHRLAAVHSLAKFIGMRSPLQIAWATEIRSIPFKKTAKNMIGYLERAEMDALLKAPDRRTALGDRDHAILLFLYNSGARADEAAGLLIGNLQLKGSPAVRIMGKGNKWRLCPLWPATVTALFAVGHRSQRNRPGIPWSKKRTHDSLRHTQARGSLRKIGIEVHAVIVLSSASVPISFGTPRRSICSAPACVSPGIKHPQFPRF